MRALLLSGGAFRGAIQLPIIEHLFAKHQYDFIYGVSVGSINGVMAAQHDLPLLREMWEAVDGKQGFLTLKWWWPFQGLYSMRPLQKKLEKHVSLSKLQIPFAAGVVSMTNGKYYNIQASSLATDKHLHDIVLASSAMSGIMVPPTIDIRGQKHIGADGGFRNIIPVPPAGSYDHLDIITCKPIRRTKMEPAKKSILSYLTTDIEIMEDEIFQRDILEIRARCGVNTHITIYSPQKDPLPSFDAARETIEYRFKLGREAIHHPKIIK